MRLFQEEKNKNGVKLLAQANHEINTNIAYDPANQRRVNLINFQYTHLSRVYSAVCASIGI